LLGNGIELLDAYGPLEMWGNLKGRFEMVTVAREKGEVAMGCVGTGPTTCRRRIIVEALGIELRGVTCSSPQ